MKVLNVIWAFSTGGIGKCFLTYAALGKYDPEIEIISVCIDLKNCDYDRGPLLEAGVRIVPIKGRKDLDWVKSLGKIAAEVRPDVVFCHGFNGPVVVKVSAMFEKSLRVPMVCTYHGLYNPPTKSKAKIANMINKVQAWMYKKYTKTVVLVAKYSGEYLNERGVPECKMEVVYNGIAIDVPVSGSMPLENDGVSIGLAARIDAIKGIEYLLQAVKILKEMTEKKFHLYVVGDGPLLEEQKRKVIELGIEDVVSYKGYSSKVAEWLKAWDIFCLPSLQENHSIALLEAMRAGKAIVCTSVGGNPETVVDGKEALVVPARDSRALANALVKFIESETLRKQMGDEAKARFVNCFTEDVMKRELCRVLKQASAEV